MRFPMTDDLAARLKEAFLVPLRLGPEPVKPPATLSDPLKTQLITKAHIKDVEKATDKSVIQRGLIDGSPSWQGTCLARMPLSRMFLEALRSTWSS